MDIAFEIGARLGKLEVRLDAIAQGFEALAGRLGEIEKAIAAATADKEAQLRVDREQERNRQMAELREQLAEARKGADRV